MTSPADFTWCLSFWLTLLMQSAVLLDGLAQDTEKMDYPKTRTSEHVDEYFGVRVEDPYQWLETDVRESDEVRDWVQRQQAFTAAYIEALPYREQIEARLTKLLDYEKFGIPFRRGDRYYYSRNAGLQNHSAIFQLDRLDDEPSILIDPNEWSSDGTVALGGMAFSDDGRYVAYAVQDAGSDWRTWRVMEIATGQKMPDEVRWIKFGDVSWTPDSKGFFYSRYDEPVAGEAFQSTNTNQKVYYHRLGTDQADDKLIHQDPEHPDWGFSPQVTDDGQYLVITVWKGTDDRYRILYQPLEEPGARITELVDNFDNEFTFLGNEGPLFYFKSDVNAPRKNILTIDITKPERENWDIVIPQANEAMQGASIVGDMIIVDYLRDAKTQIKLYDLDGDFVREVRFPGIGTASGFEGKRDHDETFYSFSSFNRPPAIYRYELATGESRLFRQSDVDFNPDDYTVEQVFYSSRDGTRVPMFIAHRKDLKRDGRNPTLLYGYGGFNISLTPAFSVSRLQWMEMGGVFAMANLRGGGEYGKLWHQAGTGTQKQNVFDDFMAAAEWLTDHKYTSPEHLGIQGGSNGGLLVGACMTQRPDLFGACLPAVGVMDMLRFQNFTAGRFWVDDYGSSTSSEEEFRALRDYSPYHNIDDGVAYPPTLILTADTDDRVVPGHSFKFAARLQEAQAGPDPILIRIETRAGHGAGKPTAKIIEEVADQWAFLAKHLGLQPQFPSDR